MSKKNNSLLGGARVAFVVAYLKRHKFLSIALAIWIAVVALTLLILAPRLDAIAKLRVKINTEDKKLTQIQQKLLFLQTLDATSLHNQEIDLQKALPSQKPVTPLLASLEILARNAGILLSSFELSPGLVASQSAATPSEKSGVMAVTRYPNIGALPLKMEVHGEFSQMNAFFRSLDLLVPLVQVRSIGFTALSQKKDSGSTEKQYRAEVELDSLYTLSEAKTTEPPETLPALKPEEITLITRISQLVANPPTPISPQASPVSTGSARPRDSIFVY